MWVSLKKLNVFDGGLFCGSFCSLDTLEDILLSNVPANVVFKYRSKYYFYKKNISTYRGLINRFRRCGADIFVS